MEIDTDTRVYPGEDFSDRCAGCYSKPEDYACEPRKCAKAIGVAKCSDCKEAHCITPVVRYTIEPKSILADDVTWAVLPYVHAQYGN